ncbi:MAG: DUF1016 N-terminal domain-containing protein [Candidatus Coatesbacteria bacterium]|mgnify:CR=1 FL=1
MLESARAAAYRAVNTAMVQAYWQVGRLIVEHEQGGRKRAAYGEVVLEELSRRLTADFGRGFTATNLRYMRAFYVAFPIQHAVRAESGHGRKQDATRLASAVGDSVRELKAAWRGKSARHIYDALRRARNGSRHSVHSAA